MQQSRNTAYPCQMHSMTVQEMYSAQQQLWSKQSNAENIGQ